MDLKDNNDPVTNLKRTGYGSFIPGWALGALALVVVLVLLAFFTSCGKDSPAPGADVTAGAIIQNPGAYLGKTVTVSGEVEKIFGPRAFNMDSGVNVGELLVLGAEPFPNVPDSGNRAYGKQRRQMQHRLGRFIAEAAAVFPSYESNYLDLVSNQTLPRLRRAV